jgi:hypothetical protein
MRKCLIAVLYLALIIFFSNSVSAQTNLDKRRQSTPSVLSEARIKDKRKINKTFDKPVEIINFQPSGEFNPRFERNKPFFYKTKYSSHTNTLKEQFNFKPTTFNFNPNGESEKSEIEDVPDDKISSPKKEKFHWIPALAQSLIVLGIQHSFRMTEPKTTSRLKGPFLADWKKSLGNLRGWDDGGKFFTNYVAHPFQGAVTGRIFINNSDRAKKQEFGKSKTYWESRLKALAWSAIWSTQFELGPLSEASLGNVGFTNNSGRSALSWCDLIITPVLGTGVVIGEDAIDKYILKNWLEKRAGYKLTTSIKILRSFLTPATSFSNLLRGKPPWKRDNRPRFEVQTNDN